MFYQERLIVFVISVYLRQYAFFQRKWDRNQDLYNDVLGLSSSSPDLEPTELTAARLKFTKDVVFLQNFQTGKEAMEGKASH